MPDQDKGDASQRTQGYRKPTCDSSRMSPAAQKRGDSGTKPSVQRPTYHSADTLLEPAQGVAIALPPE